MSELKKQNSETTESETDSEKQPSWIDKLANSPQIQEAISKIPEIYKAY